MADNLDASGRLSHGNGQIGSGNLPQRENSGTKWTPGPWRVDTDHVGDHWRLSLSVMDADGGEVCATTRGYESEDGEDAPSWSNAHLIAAAPELYQELQDILEWFCGPNGVYDEDSQWFAGTRKVMAKARGEGK